jgi:hypothetical protein
MGIIFDCPFSLIDIGQLLIQRFPEDIEPLTTEAIREQLEALWMEMLQPHDGLDFRVLEDLHSKYTISLLVKKVDGLDETFVILKTGLRKHILIEKRNYRKFFRQDYDSTHIKYHKKNPFAALLIPLDGISAEPQLLEKMLHQRQEISRSIIRSLFTNFNYANKNREDVPLDGKFCNSYLEYLDLTGLSREQIQLKINQFYELIPRPESWGFKAQKISKLFRREVIKFTWFSEISLTSSEFINGIFAFDKLLKNKNLKKYIKKMQLYPGDNGFKDGNVLVLQKDGEYRTMLIDYVSLGYGYCLRDHAGLESTVVFELMLTNDNMFMRPRKIIEEALLKPGRWKEQDEEKHIKKTKAALEVYGKDIMKAYDTINDIRNEAQHNEYFIDNSIFLYYATLFFEAVAIFLKDDFANIPEGILFKKCHALLRAALILEKFQFFRANDGISRS